MEWKASSHMAFAC